MPGTELTRPAFSDFIPEALDGLEAAALDYLDSFDIHKAFVYYTAVMFETTEEARFRYTDGGRELGIDFFVEDPQTYRLYQCKCPDDLSPDISMATPTFGTDAVQDLERALRFMTDDNSTLTNVKPELLEMRTHYRRDLREQPEQTELYVALAVLGVLTPGARAEFQVLHDNWLERGVSVELFEWTDFYDRIHALEVVPDEHMAIRLQIDDIEKDMLKQRNWVYCLVHASDLVKAYEQYGTRLFDLNVRAEMRSSKVNQSIIKSVKAEKSRNHFHHLNNGLLITCNGYRLPSANSPYLAINAPQVINGCQTVTSLFRAYNETLSEPEQAHFDANVRVQAKIIQNASQDLVDEIVISTNNQNPMNSRNLKSNSREQKEIQKAFANLPNGSKWFYIRKDGEYEAYCQRGQGISWFRKRDYEYVSPGGGRPRIRKMDNADLAKSWYAWTGHSGAALIGGLDYFGTDSIYDRLFLARPNDDFWSAFGSEAFERVNDDQQFEGLPPTAHQLLLAWAVRKFIKAALPSHWMNRRQAIIRAILAGSLQGDAETGTSTSPSGRVAQVLLEDRKYTDYQLLYNMQDVLAELFAYVLVLRYSNLGPNNSRALLQLPDVSAWVNGACGDKIEQFRLDHADSLLCNTMDFLQWAMTKNYFVTYDAEIRAGRPKAYLARRLSIKAMRESIRSVNQLSSRLIETWHPSPGPTFVETLPSIR